MKKWTAKLCMSAVLACGLALGTYTAAAAQQPVQAPRTNRRTATQPATAQKPRHRNTFRGVAERLNTTPEAMESAYQTAKQANVKLTRGQFVAANMLAHNLGQKNSNVTSQAILDGLKSGKSVGQTLQGLGLSATEAKEAQRQANRDAEAARRQGD